MLNTGQANPIPAAPDYDPNKRLILEAPEGSDQRTSLTQAPTTGGQPNPNLTQPPQSQFGLDTDPNVITARALEQMGYGQLDAGLKAARERAIYQFGDPSLADEAGFGLDPQAGAFARQNYLSGNATSARLDKQHELARQAIINNLAARGILFSGDTGYLQGEENRNYGNESYDARQKVLDYLASLFGDYNDKRSGLTQNTQNARLAAITNYLQNPDAYTNAFGSPATAPPAAVAAAQAPKRKPVSAGDVLTRYLANRAA